MSGKESRAKMFYVDICLCDVYERKDEELKV